MIISALINFALIIVNGLVGLLPTGGNLNETEIGTAITSIFSLARELNGWFPLGTLFTILGLGLIIEGSLMGWHIVSWVYNKIRGSG